MYKYFKGIYNLEKLKNAYKKLAMKYHPDLNPKGLEIMKAINNEYERLFEILKLRANESENQKEHTKEKSSDFVDLISKLIILEGLIIEIVGTWVWVSGDSYQHKEQLNKLGFRWSRGRKKWYKGEIKSKNKHYKKEKFSEIANRYGYEKMEGKKNKVYQLG